MPRSHSYSRKRDHVINTLVMAGGAWLVWYFSGPIGGELLRSAYEFYYNMRYGEPGFFDVIFFANRGHITHLGYDWSECICAAISAPIFFTLSNMMTSRLGRCEETDIDEDDEENETQMEKKLDELTKAVNKLQAPHLPEQDITLEKRNSSKTVTPLRELSNDDYDQIERVSSQPKRRCNTRSDSNKENYPK